MPKYVDAFVLAVPKKNLTAYRRMSREAGRVWRKLGAVEYIENVGDDLKNKWLTFPRMLKLKRGEVPIFSWIIYKSRAHRDAVNGKVMKDPRILRMMKQKPPFDVKRMAYGGFKAIVDM